MTEAEFNLKVQDFVQKAKAKGVPDDAITLYIKDRRDEFVNQQEGSTSDWELKESDGKLYKFNKKTGELVPVEGGPDSTILEDLENEFGETTETTTVNEEGNLSNAPAQPEGYLEFPLSTEEELAKINAKLGIGAPPTGRFADFDAQLKKLGFDPKDANRLKLTGQ